MNYTNMTFQEINEMCKSMSTANYVEPCGPLTEPCDSITEPCDSITEPCEPILEPCQLIEEPCEFMEVLSSNPQEASNSSDEPSTGMCPHLKGSTVQENKQANNGNFFGNIQNILPDFNKLGKNIIQRYVDEIESLIAKGDKKGAAVVARELYKLFERGGIAKGYLTASKFMKRWLDKIGGTYKMTDEEMRKIFDTEFAWSLIGTRFQAKCEKKEIVKRKDTVRRFYFQDITLGESNRDIHYSLGTFQVYFTGTYEFFPKTRKLKLNGLFEIEDRYDWQDPQGKSVDIMGVMIKDEYGKLVEDYDLATPFEVRGEIRYEKEFEINLVNIGR